MAEDKEKELGQESHPPTATRGDDQQRRPTCSEGNQRHHNSSRDDAIRIVAKGDIVRRTTSPDISRENQSEAVTSCVVDDPDPTQRPHKRLSVDQESHSADLDNLSEAADADQTRRGSLTRPRRPLPQGRVQNKTDNGHMILVGHWRDSPVPNPIDKHAVVAFIDVRDRLRTRIQPYSCSGKALAERYPLQPGAGSTWVTFERVAFISDLVGLDAAEVKEYVRLQLASSTPQTHHSEVERVPQLISQAKQKARTRPSSQYSLPPPLIAYGPDLPDHACRKGPKRQRTLSQDDHSSDGTSPKVYTEDIPTDRLLRTSEYGVLLGLWNSSRQDGEQQSTPVYGAFDSSGTFKLNFAIQRDAEDLGDDTAPLHRKGIGILLEQVDLEVHLKMLNPAQIENYCQIRLRQTRLGEQPQDKAANEDHAVRQARTLRVLNQTGKHASTVSYPMLQPAGVSSSNGHRGANPPEISRSDPKFTRHSDVGDRFGYSSDMYDRTTVKHQESSAGTTGAKEAKGSNLLHNPETNDAQNQQHIIEGANSTGSISHSGTSYARKLNGPFKGKLATKGNLITIDGEDYVEYRVLTKPVFF